VTFRLRIILGLLCAAQLTHSVSAQNSSPAVEQARLFQRTGGTTGANVTADGTALPDENASNEQDDSFGKQQVLKEEPPVQNWIVAGGASVFFTNNVALARSGTISDVFGVFDGSVSWVPKLGKELQLQVGARSSIFRYNDTSALDFEALGAGVGLAWTPDWAQGIGFFGRYDFTELLDKHSDELLSDHEFTLGAQKTFVLGRSHAFALGVIGSAGISDPFAEQRDQVGGFIGYHLQITRKIETDLAYRLGYYFYNDGGRRDLNGVFSASAAYHLTNWAAITAFLALGDNWSNKSAFDYQVFTGGGGLSLNVRF
jgi:hypothetical protein